MNTCKFYVFTDFFIENEVQNNKWAIFKKVNSVSFKIYRLMKNHIKISINKKYAKISVTTNFTLSLSSSCEFWSFVYLFHQEPCFISIFIPDSRIDKRTVSKGLLRLRLQINISWSPHRCKHYKWQVMELTRTHQVVRTSAIFIFFLLLRRHRCILFQSFSEKEGTDYRKKAAGIRIEH